MPNIEKRRLLLLSTSTVYGQGYLDYAEPEIRAFLGGIERVLFFPYAMFDKDGYTAAAKRRFEAMHLELQSLHQVNDKREAVSKAEAIFIGGGNTFRLLKVLYDAELIKAVRHRVESGMPYLGASAGANVAGPTIMTTNDMPIVEPMSLKALNLINFQINPHYLDADPESKLMAETREQRLMQYLEENTTPVLGMREGAMLRLDGGVLKLKGAAGARLFRRGQGPEEVKAGADLSELL